MTSGIRRFGLGISNCRPVPSVVSAVRRAEELGAEIAFVAEDVNCRDAFQLCALSATATSAIRLATGVVNPYTRNPTSLSMAIATLDQISEGRAVLGLGTSSPSLIEEQMGIPAGKQVRVMREAIHIIRGLLAGETLTYSGERFIYRNAHLEVRPVQQRVPIFFAAMGPQMLRLAGSVADGVLLNVGASVEYVRWAVAEIRAGAGSLGRGPEEVTVAAWLSTYVGEDYQSGLRRAAEWLATMLSIPRQGELLLERSSLDSFFLADVRRLVGRYPHRGDPAAAARFIPEGVVERLALVGTADEVRRRIEEYCSAGVALPVLGPSAIRDLFAT